MADDYSNNASTTGSIGAGGSIFGNLEVSNDQDWFVTPLTAGYFYQFTLTATATTTSPIELNVALKDVSGGTIAGSNGTNGARNKVITVAPTTSGTYYVQVDSRVNSSTGGYQLSESAPDDYTNTLATAGRIRPGQTLSAGLQAAGDSDWFAISLVAGYSYQFTLSGTTDTVNPIALDLNLLNSNAVVVSSGGSSQAKTITYTPTVSGTYYVEANSNNGISTGTYQLNASSQDDYAANGTTIGRFTSVSVGGTLEGADDVDWIAVSLTAGSTYAFTISATASTVNPTGLSISLLNGTGTAVANGNSSTKTVTFNPTTGGTYYLQASSLNGASLGSYIISSGTTSGGTGTGTSPGNSATTLPVYRFFDSKTGTQFLTSSTSERDNVINTRSDLKSEGVGLNAVVGTDPNATAIYRFFDKVYGTHFFTQSASERDTILSSRSDLGYEGVGFYDYAGQQAGSTPVYRFFDSKAGTHFFTASASERATILATRSDLIAEGISFYSPT